jgi:hypothetical protein
MALGLVPFESQAAPSAVMRNGSATKWSPIGLAAGILLCPNIPSVAQTLSIRMESSPPWSVRNEPDQVLNRRITSTCVKGRMCMGMGRRMTCITRSRRTCCRLKWSRKRNRANSLDATEGPGSQAGPLFPTRSGEPEICVKRALPDCQRRGSFSDISSERGTSPA